MGTVENPPTRLVDGSEFQVGMGAGFVPIPTSGASERYIHAAQFSLFLETPEQTVATGLNGWAMDPDTNEVVQVSFMFPDNWDMFDATLYWSNGDTGAGDVVWAINYEDIAVGSVPGAGIDASVTGTASTTVGLIVATPVISSGACVSNSIMRLRVTRDATDEDDTVDNDVIFHGVLLTRVVK